MKARRQSKNWIDTATVTGALVLSPLLEDRGRITESVLILVPVYRMKQNCFQITTKRVRRSQQFQFVCPRRSQEFNRRECYASKMISSLNVQTQGASAQLTKHKLFQRSFELSKGDVRLPKLFRQTVPVAEQRPPNWLRDLLTKHVRLSAC